MKKLKPADKRFYIVLAVIGVLLIGWWAWGQFSPKPLGDKLEYIGREDYGSWLPLSSARPTAVYYYATNLSANEIEKNYFKNAELANDDQRTDSRDYDNQYIRLTNKETKKKFLVVHYLDSLATTRKNHLPGTDKKHILTVDSFNYDTAKDSL